MSDTLKTLIAVALAAALVGVVWLTRPAPVTSAQFSDVGQVFYPDFTDPLAAKSLEVVAFDEATATFKPFKVEFDGARWVIPSHHGYPADAEKRMAEAASAFIGLTKEQVVSDQPSEQQALGVLRPDDDAAPLTGRGTRVTIRDGQGRVLSDLILGKDAPAGDSPGAHPKRRYVRLPGQNRVYAATLEKSFSTRFADWVETDLLRLTGGDAGTVNLDRVEIDRYSIDESTGRQKPGQTVIVSRAPQDAATAKPAPGSPPVTWKVETRPGGPPGPDETVSGARVDELVNTLRNLKIVGVRAKPANLASVLAGTSESGAINTADQLSLQSRGFYLTKSGQLLANDGQLSAYASDGVVYTLWFGEVLYGSGEEVSAGVEPAKDGAEKSKGEGPKGAESRYIFITVKFDDTLIPEPKKPEPVAQPAATDGARPAADGATEPAETGAAPGEPNPASAASEPKVDERAMAQYQAEVAARNGKVASGKARAAALAKRFADWYYVIDGASFDKLHPTRADLITPAHVGAGPAAPVPPEGAATPAPLNRPE